MGMLVHEGWTNVDLSWNQLWANLPKIFEPFLEIWVCPILSQGAHFWPKNLQPVRTARGPKPLQELFLAKFGPFWAVLAQN